MFSQIVWVRNMRSAWSLLWFSAKKETEKERGSERRKEGFMLWDHGLHSGFPQLTHVPDPFRPPSSFSPNARRNKKDIKGNAASWGRWQKYSVCVNVMVPAASREWSVEIKRNSNINVKRNIRNTCVWLLRWKTRRGCHVWQQTPHSGPCFY